MVKRTTYIIFALGLSTNVLGNSDWLNLFSITTASFFGTIIPDWDLRVGHRMILYNIFALLSSFVMLVVILKCVFNITDFLSLSFAYLIGYLSHLFLDLLTGSVAILYPVKDKRFSLLKIKYNNSLLNIILIFFGLILIYLKIIKFYYNISPDV